MKFIKAFAVSFILFWLFVLIGNLAIWAFDVLGVGYGILLISFVFAVGCAAWTGFLYGEV